MLKLTCLITVTDIDTGSELEFDFVNSVEIEKSRKTLTNTAKLIIARKLKLFKNSQLVDINTIFKRGSHIVIKLGYNDDLKTEFTGFISSVGASVPLEIKCQDEMWSLKQNNFTKSWQKVKVAEIVKYVYAGEAKVVDLELGSFIIRNISTAQTLEKLRESGIRSYFDNGILIVDFAGVVNKAPKEVIYNFSKNIIENNLEYKKKEDSRIKVVATSKLPTGKKIEITLGDPDGEVHTLHYNNMDKDQMQKIAQVELDLMKYEGYKGSIKAFGIPYIDPGYVAVLYNDDYPENDGSYLVESVKVTFGMDGFRREVDLESKVA